jgi:hypothetical protein
VTENHCYSCSQTFALDENNRCVCLSGYYLDETEKKCIQEGIKVWIIALSVGTGVLLLALITGM